MKKNRKISVVVRAIAEAKAIIPKGQEVKVCLSNVLKDKQLRVQELYDILRKLEGDEKILTIMHFPHGLLHIRDGWGKIYPPKEFDLSNEYFTVKLLRRFDKWCADYWKWTKEDAIRCMTELEDPFELLALRQSKQPANLKQDFSEMPKEKEKDLPEDETTYRITFTKGREILLNDSYQIATPDFERENEQVFSYLYNHPNEKFTKKQLEGALKIGLVKSFHKTVENLGFIRGLRKAFFSVSQDCIEFRNPTRSKELSPTVVAELKSLITKD